MIPYTKPHRTYEEQISILKKRGMTINDEAKTKAFLQKIGYYRLSGYWHPFFESKPAVREDGELYTQVLDTFRKGTEFQQAVELYIFDKKLRIMMLDALERIEIALRVDVAYILGKVDGCAHRKIEFLNSKFFNEIDEKTGHTRYQGWLDSIDRKMERSSEEFIKHYKLTYNTPLPIWISVELWDFGDLSWFISGMRFDDLLIIANRYGLKRPYLLTSWIRNMNLVRNICAHHGRLWNRSLVDSAKMPKNCEIPLLDHLMSDNFARYHLYGAAAIMRYMLHCINPTSTWGERLKNLFETFPRAPGICIGQSGFPENWQSFDLWAEPSR